MSLISLNRKQLTSYHEYLLRAKRDTAFQKPQQFDEFIRNLTDIDYKNHIITLVVSNAEDNKFNFRRFTWPLLKPIIENKFFTQRYSIFKSRNENEINALEKTKDKLDTLQKIYNKVLLEKGHEKDQSSNTIYLGQNTEQNNEEWIYDKYLATTERLGELNSHLKKNDDIIKIVADFSPRGTKLSRLPIAIQGTLIGFGSVVFVLLLIGLYRKVVEFEKKIS